MTFQIARSVINALPYAYADAVERFRQATLAHRCTSDVAPSAPDIVAQAVRRVPGGEGQADDFVADYEIIENVAAPTPSDKKAAPAGRPTLYTAEIAERILERLANGRSLGALCKDEGMPPPSTVLDWVREDRDGFAARYQDARKIGNSDMRSHATLYSDAVAERMLDELRRGRALRDVCQDDSMPAVRTVTRWAENDRDGFAVRYLAARTAGHALMARYTLYTPKIPDLILDELCNGRSLADVCGDPSCPRFAR